MPVQPVLPDSVIEAFRLMWNKFPGPAALVHRSGLIMAANPAARRQGYADGAAVPLFSPEEVHAGGTISDAGEALWKIDRTPGSGRGIYRVPLEVYQDFFLYFSIVIDERRHND